MMILATQVSLKMMPVLGGEGKSMALEMLAAPLILALVTELS